MQTRDHVSDDGDEALLALRRTLWQLAMAGVAFACMVERCLPDAQAVALWCVLAPACALAIHCRDAIMRQLRHGLQGEGPAQALADGYPSRAGRPRRASTRPRRKAAMALRRGPAMVRAGTR